ncbi:MAG: inositol monophosphatase family protein [Trueperaceae bacterium]
MAGSEDNDEAQRQPQRDPVGNLRPFLHTAILAAREAARIQLGERGADLDLRTKSSDIDPVTRVDLLCEARIREVILDAHPDHVVLGEEQGQRGRGGYRWVVDPLDGTVNYAHGFPFYCVSIALEIDGELAVGVVYDGEHDELFTAVRGEGAHLSGRPIAVSHETVMKRALLGTGFAYTGPDIRRNLEVFARTLPEVQSIRRPGAAALDVCYVACGRLDGFWELSLQPWDVAAAVLIVREAGGTVTGVGGAPYRLHDPVLVASNGHLHTRLLDVLQLETVLAGTG